MPDKDSIPKQVSGFKTEILDNEVLLYHQNRTQAIYLNSTAALIWALCDGQKSIREMENLIIDSFPEAEDNISEYIRTTIEGFDELGAIKYE